MTVIEQEVKRIIEGMGIAYSFNDWSRFNVEADMGDFPCGVLVAPASGTLHRNNGVMRNAPSYLLAFLDLTDFDFDTTENNTIVERCLGYAKEFIARVSASEVISIEGDVDYRVVYDLLDVNCTGVTIDLTIAEVVGECESALL